MTVRPVVRAVLRGALKDVRYVRPVRPGRAHGLVAEVYGQAERDFGVLAPPLALHSPAPGPLAAGWLMLRETLLVDGAVGRAVKERVATEVSRANSCPYCVEVHQAALEGLAPASVPADGDAVGAWARGSGRAPGAGRELPFPASAAPEICGVAFTFHYLNRMVAVFLADSPMPAAAPGFVRAPVMRTVTRAMRPVGPGPLRPGESLRLLPGTPAPAGRPWARENPVVADALGRAVAAVDAAARWVPRSVRERLGELLDGWDGGPVGPSRAWLTEPLATLPGVDRPAARLALLTAFAPYQVTDADVAALRARHPGDRELIELTSWAAMAAATRVAGRWQTPQTLRTPQPL
ncbi:carboxymuconolactone decarboxylase family protein [Streptomyces sp. NBC_00249]|uniref:carboxymuconolactone decarboxylase family protein n=1 Tax=Streptomyces sp. NBC_00249 TaxID=2975690 RepID=UPI0022545068|nr:carboxymuconolactone decarboxylase family protein [Streptomyces sp. NBC_00249]MCX5199539.1 carboxymuconolactone decarboxylase family protein [Streptomyces sp. NBC_00249]